MTIVIVIAALVGLLLVFAAMRPDAFRVERSIEVNAPPEKVYALLDDFHEWPKWSPWEKMDPAMQRTHSGERRGPGAAYAWKGNKKVGEGRMEIVDSAPPARLVIKLDFLKPFEAHNTVELTVTKRGAGTHLTWAMFGPANFITKLMGIFMNMDRMIGKDFEAGLANIKALAEA